jgi:hypothetical protein
LADAPGSFFCVVFLLRQIIDETAGTNLSALLGPSSVAHLATKPMILNGLLGPEE